LSLIYLAKDIYADFDHEKNRSAASVPVLNQAELDYWHQVYKKPTPEGYCDYLEKFPNGQIQFVTIAKNATGGDCLQVKRQAEAELKAKEVAEVELKAKLENEVQMAAAEKTRLETQTQANAELKNRIEALETAKTAAELKTQAEREADAQLEAELKAKFETESNPSPETGLQSEDEKNQTDTAIKVQTEANEALF
jgi:hypothetical protein